MRRKTPVLFRALRARAQKQCERILTSPPKRSSWKTSTSERLENSLDVQHLAIRSQRRLWGTVTAAMWRTRALDHELLPCTKFLPYSGWYFCEVPKRARSACCLRVTEPVKLDRGAPLKRAVASSFMTESRREP